MSANLEPCPFCGGEARPVSSTADPGWRVRCLACRAEINWRDTHDDAVVAWNRRTPDATRHALTEVMAAFRAYQSKPGPAGLQRLAAAEKQADAALAKAEGQ